MALHNIQQVALLQGHKERVWNVSWNPAGTQLASCGSDKSVRIWAREGEKWVCADQLGSAHQRTIRATSWKPDGKTLALASFDSTVTLWENFNGEFENTAALEGHENEVKSVAWNPRGDLLATCSRDKTVWVWGEDAAQDYECVSVLAGHEQDVKKVLWSPDGETLVSCSYDDTIRIWKEDPASEEWVSDGTLRGHTSTVWDASFDKAGEHLVSAGDDATLIIWKLFPAGSPLGNTKAEWKNVSTISGFCDRPVYSVSWCALTGLIAVGCGDNAIRIFEQEISSVADPTSETYTLRTCIESAHVTDVNCVAWNPAVRGQLASCGDDTTVRLWQVDV